MITKLIIVAAVVLPAALAIAVPTSPGPLAPPDAVPVTLPAPPALPAAVAEPRAAGDAFAPEVIEMAPIRIVVDRDAVGIDGVPVVGPTR